MRRTARQSATIHGLPLTRGLRLLGLMTILVAAAGCGESGAGGATGSGPVGLNAASLSWQKPTANEDGSPMTDLAGYQIYYGETSPVTPDNSQTISVLNPNQTSYVVADLTPGTYHFTVSAVNLEGSESGMSNEAVKTIF